MKNLAQVWVEPGLDLPGPVRLETSPPIELRAVELTPPNRPLFKSLLLQCEVESDEFQQWRHLGKALSRLSFLALTPFHVYCARMLKIDPQGNALESLEILGSPSGIALTEERIGFRREIRFDSNKLAVDLTPKIEGAISWFVHSLATKNPIIRLVSNWTGLETIAPEQTGPWRCSHCGAEMFECPKCGHTTEGPRAIQTIRNFLQQLGVSSKEANQLYDLRCDLSHGRIPMDAEGAQRLSDAAMRTEELLLLALKRALGWSDSSFPKIDPSGYVIAGAPGLGLVHPSPASISFDKPSLYPG